jgi:hypothetical protein
MPTHFLHHGNRKNRHGRSRLRYVSSRRMALRNHNLSLDVLRNDFGEVDETMFQGIERPCKINFCIHGIEKATWTKSFKWDLSIRMDQRTNNLASERTKKRLRWSRWSDVSRCRRAMPTYFLHLRHRRKRLWRICVTDVLSRRMALRTHNLSSRLLKKKDFVEVGEVM